MPHVKLLLACIKSSRKEYFKYVHIIVVNIGQLQKSIYSP